MAGRQPDQKSARQQHQVQPVVGNLDAQRLGSAQQNDDCHRDAYGKQGQRGHIEGNLRPDSPGAVGVPQREGHQHQHRYT